MRRAAAVSVVLAGLGLSAPAGADVTDTYQELAARGLDQAPLVPTSVPPSLAPIDRTVGTMPTRGGRGYGLRFVHYGPNGPDAVMVVKGGEFRTMRALLRDHRKLGFGAPRPTRIRGHRGYLLTRRLGPVTRTLAWRERGVVHAVGSGTPRKISLAQLRSAAKGLDRLERSWIGAASDPNNSSEAFGVTTARTVTLHVSFEATCAPPGSSAVTVRVGQAGVTLFPREGNAFTFDIAAHRRDSAPWSGTITGAIAPGAITLDIRATGTIEGDVCDTGALTLTLDRRLR